MAAFYNEIDPFAAAWLRKLIEQGHIAPGIVDERSIEDIRPDELKSYTQCHFFAGVGAWSYILRQAGWPDSRPVWTGSCPCQPFSAAGKGNGFADERHLWPAFNWLITQCRPDTIFGEQVASKIGLSWLDLVQTDMEAKNYAFGAVDTCSAGFGAPHIRQRLYWVADTNNPRLERWVGMPERSCECSAGAGGLALGLADLHGDRCAQGRGAFGPARHDGTGRDSADDRPGPTNGRWRAADWLHCRDDKWRPVEPDTFPLAHGAPARVGRLRGYGNAINVAQAQAFIEAYLEIETASSPRSRLTIEQKLRFLEVI